MAATVEQLTNPDALKGGMAVVSASRFAMGPGSGVFDRIAAPARLRLYRACLIRSWILDPDSPFDVRVGGRP